ncbi:MAG: 4'-phosphopantetheinyl transferase superfamily protein [Clostridium sp.]|nr:4'-phosphopantetheinyl transferase superfamily protein [Clostridium sp.]
MDTKIYIADTSVLEDDILFNEKYSTISEQRKEKINKLRFPADKRLCLGATLLLDYALKKHNLNEADMQYSFNKYGKPYFSDKKDLHFSISHAGHYALCAVSDKEIGCDIEQIGRVSLNIAKRFFSDDEYSKVQEADEKDKSIILTKLWTLKESYIKAMGKGLSEPLNSFSVTNIDNFHTASFDSLNGYIISVCSKYKDLKLYIIDNL